MDATELLLDFGIGAPKPDYQGLRQLDSHNVVRPYLFTMKESASEFLYFPVLNRRVRIFMPGERRIINYVPDPMRYGGAVTLAAKEHSTGVGFIELPAGKWWLHTPVVTAEGTRLLFVCQDATLGNEFDAATSIGGAASDELTAAATPTTAAITDADSAILAADVSRKMVVLANPSNNRVWLRYGGGAPVAGSGHFVPPLGDLIIGDGKDYRIAAQAIRGICEAGLSVTLGVQAFS